MMTAIELIPIEIITRIDNLQDIEKAVKIGLTLISQNILEQISMMDTIVIEIAHP